MDDALRLSTRHTGGTLTIAVTGALDFATAPQLLACLDGVFNQLAHGARSHNGGGPATSTPAIEQLVIDSRNLSFIDARGLGVLVAIKNRARRHRLPLLLVEIPAPLHRLLTITDMHRHFSAPPGQ